MLQAHRWKTAGYCTDERHYNHTDERQYAIATVQMKDVTTTQMKDSMLLYGSKTTCYNHTDKRQYATVQMKDVTTTQTKDSTLLYRQKTFYNHTDERQLATVKMKDSTLLYKWKTVCYCTDERQHATKICYCTDERSCCYTPQMKEIMSLSQRQTRFVVLSCTAKYTVIVCLKLHLLLCASNYTCCCVTRYCKSLLLSVWLLVTVHQHTPTLLTRHQWYWKYRTEKQWCFEPSPWLWPLIQLFSLFTWYFGLWRHTIKIYLNAKGSPVQKI